MIRIIKDPKKRRAEIIKTAKYFFQNKGYEKTSVNDIIEKNGVAKGTFYHYFKSKNEVLTVIVDEILNELISYSREVLRNDSLDPLEKIKKIFLNQKSNIKNSDRIKKSLHLKENRELHEKINVQIVLQLSPIIKEIVEEGNREGVFNIKSSLEKVEFLIAASQFLFDDGLFFVDLGKQKARRKAMQEVFEKSLGAKKDSFNFFNFK